MKTNFLTLIIFLALGSFGSGQELSGPEQVTPGTLATFEISPPQNGAWVVTPINATNGTYQVDEAAGKLYFAAPNEGEYTVIAAIVSDGKPLLLTKTFVNGRGGVIPNPSPNPPPVPPVPTPPVNDLGAWIQTNLPLLVKSQNIQIERKAVAESFLKIADKIDKGVIKTPQNAQAQIRIMLVAELAKVSRNGVNDWMEFLSELSVRIEKELGDDVNNLDAIKRVFLQAGNALKLAEIPLKQTLIPTQQQMLDCPTCVPTWQPVQDFYYYRKF